MLRFPIYCCCLAPQLCLTLGDPMHSSPPGSSVLGVFQTRILEWVDISFSRGSSRPRNQTHVSWIAGRFFTVEPPGNPSYLRIKWVKICKVFRRVSDLFSCPFSNIVNKHTSTYTHMRSSSSYLSSDEREKDIASWLIMWKLHFIPCPVHCPSKSRDIHRACEIRAVCRGGSPATWGFSFLSRHWDEV